VGPLLTTTPDMLSSGDDMAVTMYVSASSAALLSPDFQSSWNPTTSIPASFSTAAFSLVIFSLPSSHTTDFLAEGSNMLMTGTGERGKDLTGGSKPYSRTGSATTSTNSGPTTGSGSAAFGSALGFAGASAIAATASGSAAFAGALGFAGASALASGASRFAGPSGFAGASDFAAQGSLASLTAF